MDLDDIRLFVKVAELKSFVNAATELRMQTSLVSRRVARLEETLGIRLLQRTTRRVSLTEEGARFLAETSRGLDQLSAAVDSLHSLHGAPKGKVRVTSQIEIGQYLVEQVMPGFYEKYPDIQIEWDLLSTNKSLVEGGIDVAIRNARSLEQTVTQKRIGTLTPQLFRSPNLAVKIKRHSAAEDLEHLPWLVFSRGPLVSQRVKVDVDIRGTISEVFPKNVRFRTNSLVSIRHAIVQGLGVGFLPSLIADADVANGLLTTVCPDNSIAAPTVEFYAAYPSREYLAPKVRVFIDWLVANFPENAKSIKPPKK